MRCAARIFFFLAVSFCFELVLTFWGASPGVLPLGPYLMPSDPCAGIEILLFVILYCCTFVLKDKGKGIRTAQVPAAESVTPNRARKSRGRKSERLLQIGLSAGLWVSAPPGF